VFQARAVEDGDASSRVLDQSRLLQLDRPFGDPFPAHAEHVGDQLLGHDELVAAQTIEAQQQPAAQLLVERMVPIAYRRLRHLSDQRLRVAKPEAVFSAAPRASTA
jgi:hypothetical protein